MPVVPAAVVVQVAVLPLPERARTFWFAPNDGVGWLVVPPVGATIVAEPVTEMLMVWGVALACPETVTWC